MSDNDFNTSRAVLSYSQLRGLTGWPEILIRDYLGILDDTVQVADQVAAIPTPAGADWTAIATNAEYTGEQTSISAGVVYEADYSGGTVYRFISTALGVNGYPDEDSFYSSFDGVTPTNLIDTRG